MPPSHGGFIVAACGARPTDVHGLVERWHIRSNIRIRLGGTALGFYQLPKLRSVEWCMRIFVFDKHEMSGEERLVFYVGTYVDRLFVEKM